LSLYDRRLVRRRILASAPMACTAEADFEVHVLTCERDVLDAIWCLKTFYHFADVRPGLVIHDDGSLTPDSIDTLSRHFVDCRVVRRSDADREVARFLADRAHSRANRRKKDFYCALKLWDPLVSARSDKLLLLDSDVLFFREPTELLDHVTQGRPCFASDYQSAYARPIPELDAMFGVDVLDRVNAGVLFLDRGFYVDHLDLVEAYFETMDGLPPIEDVNRHEQTLNAILMSKCGAARLSSPYQIAKTPLTDETVAHHFVSDGSRRGFYERGLRRLRRRGFLAALAAAGSGADPSS
jgi:hypothetical protein